MDELIGDQGDTLTGGADTDVFTAYRETGDGAVLITDFDVLTERLTLLIDGPATGTLSYLDGADGLAIRLDGEFVAVLQGVTSAQFDRGSISLQSAA